MVFGHCNMVPSLSDLTFPCLFLASLHYMKNSVITKLASASSLPCTLKLFSISASWLLNCVAIFLF